MQCPLCGYQLSDFDAVCPKCHGKGLPKSVTVAPSTPPPTLPYNPTIPRPVPVVERKGVSPWLVMGLLAIPVVCGFGFLRFSGMELRPKDAAPIATTVPTTASPPIVVTPVAAATPSPIVTPIVAKKSTVLQTPQSSLTETGAPVFTKDQTFGEYSRKTLALIAATDDPHQLARISLDLLAMSGDADRAKERAQVRNDGQAINLWSYASSLFETLGTDASERLKFLDGRAYPEAYRLGTRARGQTCSQLARMADSQLSYMKPKTAQEQESEQVLGALKKDIQGQSDMR